MDKFLTNKLAGVGVHHQDNLQSIVPFQRRERSPTHEEQGEVDRHELAGVAVGIGVAFAKGM